MRGPGMEAAPGAADSLKMAMSGDWTFQGSQKNFHVESWSQSPTSSTFYSSSINFSLLSEQLSLTHTLPCTQLFPP